MCSATRRKEAYARRMRATLHPPFALIRKYAASIAERTKQNNASSDMARHYTNDRGSKPKSIPCGGLRGCATPTLGRKARLR